jgi:hypothetical protein
MVTDTKTLLVEGLKLAAEDLPGRACGARLGYRRARRVRDPPDQQGPHRRVRRLLGIDPKKVLTVFPEVRQRRPRLDR